MESACCVDYLVVERRILYRYSPLNQTRNCVARLCLSKKRIFKSLFILLYVNNSPYCR